MDWVETCVFILPSTSMCDARVYAAGVGSAMRGSADRRARVGPDEDGLRRAENGRDAIMAFHATRRTRPYQ